MNDAVTVNEHGYRTFTHQGKTYHIHPSYAFYIEEVRPDPRFGSLYFPVASEDSVLPGQLRVDDYTLDEAIIQVIDAFRAGDLTLAKEAV